MAVSGIFPSIVARRRDHKESSIVRLLFGGAAGSYTQSYPQVWITGTIPGCLDSGSATERGPGRDVSSIPSNTGQALHVQHRAPRLRAGGEPTIAAGAVARPLYLLAFEGGP